MSIPTFSPPNPPSYEYVETHQFQADRMQSPLGYDQVRPLNIHPIRVVKLHWPAMPAACREYIEAFFGGLQGTMGPFWWYTYNGHTPPTAITPTMSERLGGSESETTIYVQFTWYSISYGESLPSTEVEYTVSANYRPVITLPYLPARVATFAVYASTSSGQEVYQGDSTSWSLTKTNMPWPLTTGTASPPTEDTYSYPSRWMLSSNNVEFRKIRANRWSCDLEFTEQLVGI